MVGKRGDSPVAQVDASYAVRLRRHGPAAALASAEGGLPFLKFVESPGFLANGNERARR